MRYAIVRDGQVESFVEWDGTTQWAPPPGTTAILASEATALPVKPPAPPTEDEQDRLQIRALLDDLRNGVGTTTVRLQRVERVCVRLIRDYYL